jgi:CheY-like chemotaxis protein
MTSIAVVDDNIVSQRFMRDLFAERGWYTIPLINREEVHHALLSPAARQPDVVILDLHLVEREAGLSVLETLKVYPPTRVVPVIMCSGDVWGLQSLPEAVRADLAAVLVKPFGIDEAYECVEFVLAHGAANAQTASDASRNS